MRTRPLASHADRPPALRGAPRLPASLLLSLGIHGALFGSALWIGLGLRSPGLVVAEGRAIVEVPSPEPARFEPAAPERLEPPPVSEERHEEPQPCDVPWEPREAPPREDPPLVDPFQDADPFRGPLAWSIGPPPGAPAPAAAPPPAALPSAPAAEPAAAEEAALLEAPAPEYPPASFRRREQGTCLCRLHVAPDGRVTTVDLVESSGHERLDRAACTALHAWRFRPRRESGRAVRTTLLHRVVFRIEPAR